MYPSGVLRHLAAVLGRFERITIIKNELKRKGNLNRDRVAGLADGTTRMASQVCHVVQAITLTGKYKK